MSGEKGSWTVPPEAARSRLDRFLADTLEDETRSQIQTWVRKGWVRVNGRTVKTGYLVSPGDRIDLDVPPLLPDLPRAEPLDLAILYQDADLAVVVKPAGMVSHLGAGVHSGTLVNALLYHLGPLDTGDPARPGIVHRLDKLTSGLIVVAKNLPAHRELAHEFKQREVTKVYQALVYGRPSPPAATIDLPLGRSMGDRKKISVRSRRLRKAVTHYRTIESYSAFSLLEVRIETGRTHQIRVHLAQKGHPVAGDTIYGGHRSRNIADARVRAALERLGRHFLHACRLEFRHPRTGERMTFTSPLPPELEDFLSLLRHDAGADSAAGRPEGLP